MKSRQLHKFFAAWALILWAASSWAQGYPNKPIRLVVPFAAGGPADILARWVGEKLAANLGQSVIVDNRGGGGGAIGTLAVVTSPADGYTLLFSSVGALVITPYLSDKVSYNPKEDLAPVARVVTAPTVLVTGNSRYKTVADLVTYAKANPGKVSFASAGPGTTPHLAGELLKSAAGINIVHIPYRGIAPALTDVISTQADVIFADAPVVLPYLKGNQLHALGVCTTAPVAALAGVPTMAAAGQSGVLVSTWYGVMAPAKTPRDIIAKVNAALNTVLATPQAKAHFAEQGVQVNGGTPAEFGAFIASEATRWPAIAKAAGVKLE